VSTGPPAPRPTPPARPAGNTRRGRNINRGIQVSFLTFLTAVITSTVAEVTANKLSSLPGVFNRYLLWAVAAAGLLALVGFIVLRWITPPAPPEELPRLPPTTELIGRDELVARLVSEVRRQGAAIVRGPAGIGTSVIAINAARRLVPEAARQRYVDLRGPDPDPRRTESPRRVAIRVLRSLGITPGPFQDLERAGWKVADDLRNSGRVLVLDNVSALDQVAWVLRHVPGAYVIAAGDIGGADVPGGVAYVPVGPLDSAAGLALLRAQGPNARPRRRRDRLRGWLSRGMRPGRSIADRVAAEPAAAAMLADRYLKHPQVVIQIGRWLAANPHITIGMLLDDLGKGEESSELLVILRHQLRGASPGSRRLLSLLAGAPVAELNETAVAALAGAPVERTSRHLRELADRSLVDWIRPSRCRLPATARQLADPVRPSLRDKSRVRLAAHLAHIAGTHAEGIGRGSRTVDRLDPQAAEWFQNEDVTLLQVLKMSAPPRQAGPHLWRIADSLETWFAREDRPSDRHATAAAMAEAARFLGDASAQAMAQLRLSAIAAAEGAFDAAWEHLDHADRSRGRSDRWLPQYEAGRAVWDLVVTGDLKAAELHLDQCHKVRPRRDTAGRVIDMINLAALHIEGRNYDSAHDWLIQVLDLTENTDTGANAHARELMGIVTWRRGHEDRAREEWRAAGSRYAELGDDEGLARCLRHLAVTLLGGPERERARDMLVRSLELRDGDTGLGTALAHLYLGEDAARAGRRDEAARHRAAGLTALSPWDKQPTTPPQVSAARARLERL
jgi:tetratricopeptide (TPR) repeat protein